MTTKARAKLTLRDRLSRLTYRQACQLLGPQAEQLIRKGALYDDIDLEHDVELRRGRFRLRLPHFDSGAGPIVVTITSPASARQRIRFDCSACETVCEHVGAAFSLILEEKLTLGLAAVPNETVPLEHLTEEQLVRHAIALRAERARKEKFRLRSADPRTPWTDYTLTSAASGKTYRVALRGAERGQSFCSCPDFRINTLGTCKHVLYALDRIRQRFGKAACGKPYRNKEAFVHVLYGERMTLHLRLPDDPDPDLVKTAGRLADEPIQDVHELLRCVRRLDNRGHSVTVYPDAEELIEQRLFQDRIASLVEQIRRDPKRHPLRRELLKTELLPYQLDGIAFAVGAGRAVLADEMGLGKTIQGIGVAELLAREAQIRKVLIICPASLKSQWRSEIHRFCECGPLAPRAASRLAERVDYISNRDVQLVTGRADERAEQYDTDCFFTVCNYEQVLRDIIPIERVPWDLIILDEGQRIKNWETKTSSVVKSLQSPFALVLTGTPLENRLEELYSVVEFIDDRRLAPAFRFLHRHRVVDEKGKVIGYKNLDELRRNLQPVLLRRTRKSVLAELPPRTTEIVRIPPTDEQLELHAAHMRTVSMITRKPWISEMDLLRLQKALLMCRMAANSTFLVDKTPPGYSTKLERLAELLDQIEDEPDRKAVLFSEWTTMLNLIEPLLERRRLNHVRLDGSVPQRKRQQLVHAFQHDDRCRVFAATNAGSTGLNLQAANTVINVDLPWNPAVLEQRIARAHRMGQKNPVQVFVLITEETIEENLLATLAAKQDLALAALDADSDVTRVDLVAGIDELKRRLEVLLGAKPEAPVDETKRDQTHEQTQQFAERRERVAAAGGELLGAVFHFLDELVTGDQTPAPSEATVSQVRSRLAECVEDDSAAQPRLTVTLPDRQSLDHLAHSLAKFLLVGEQQQ